MSDEGARVLVIGWHSSRQRHLRPFERAWRRLGLEPRSVVPDTFTSMAFAGGWQRNGRALGAELARAHHASPLPWVAHVFSNAGFWSLAALLEALETRHLSLLRSYRGALIDCAPGFPERFGPLFTAKYATRAMLPGALASLGLPARDRHRLLGPPFAAFLGLWHVISPEQIAFMQESQRKLVATHADRCAPMHFVYGARDELVLPEHVEAFAERAKAASVAVAIERFEESAHVRPFVDARERYLGVIERFAASLAHAPR